MKRKVMAGVLGLGFIVVLSGCINVLFMQGNWTYSSFGLAEELRITGNQFEWITEIGPLETGWRGTFTTNEMVDPPEIDFQITEQLALGYWSDTDQTLRGIFQLQDGQLWVKTGFGSARPDNFNGAIKFERP